MRKIVSPLDGILSPFGARRGFGPAALLAGSTAFLWFDPSDLPTLFQDAAGTTPVTAPAQPVGLVLDKSRGLVLGPELVTNGTFDTDTNWTKGTGWTISGGVASKSAGVTATIQQPASIEIGKSYSVTFTLSNYVSGNVRAAVGGAGLGTNRNANGTYTETIVASGALFIYMIGDGSFTGSIDNISVRELPGFHATQSTAANRPTYGVVPSRGRVNLLTFSEQFDNAAWAKTAATVTANAAVAPDGTTTADKLVEDTATSTKFVLQSITVNSGTAYTYSVFLKAAERSFAQVRYENGLSSQLYAINVNLSDGSFTTTSFGSPTGTSAVVTLFGSGWYRVQLTVNTSDTTFKPIVFLQAVQGVNSYTGDGTSGILIWGAQLETGSTATPYQRVVSQFDVTDPAGFPSYPLHYLFFGGDLDPRWLQTSTITPSADKVQVFAGVRKLSDAAQGAVVGTFNTGIAGLFELSAPRTAGQLYGWVSYGTLPAIVASVSGYTAPITNVLTGLGDISGDLSTLRVNGSQAAQNTADQGTGNFLAYPLYIGRRAGTSLAFNGNLYGLIVRFSTANLDASLINQTERWLAQKTGVTI